MQKIVKFEFEPFVIEAAAESEENPEKLLNELVGYFAYIICEVATTKMDLPQLDEPFIQLQLSLIKERYDKQLAGYSVIAKRALESSNKSALSLPLTLSSLYFGLKIVYRENFISLSGGVGLTATQRETADVKNQVYKSVLHVIDAALRSRKRYLSEQFNKLKQVGLKPEYRGLFFNQFTDLANELALIIYAHEVLKEVEEWI